MSGARGGWLVAASVGAVEALKDQLGVCRWNYALRSMQQNAKNRVQSYYHTTHSNITNPAKSSSSAAGLVGNKMIKEAEKIKKTERSVNKVMDLSCWGPSTVRF